MQKCEKVNNTRYNDPGKPKKRRFKVKTWRGFHPFIFKLNKSTVRELKFLQLDLTINLLLPLVVTY